MNYKKIIIFTLCLIIGSSQCSYASEKEQHIKEVKKNLTFITAAGLGMPVSVTCGILAVSALVLPKINGHRWRDMNIGVLISLALFWAGGAGVSAHYIRKAFLKVLKSDQEENKFQFIEEKPLTESQKNWEFIKGCIATGLIPLSLIAVFIASASVVRKRTDPYFSLVGLASPFICWYSAKWAREKFNKALMEKKDLLKDPMFISHLTAPTDEQFPMMDERI